MEAEFCVKDENYVASIGNFWYHLKFITSLIALHVEKMYGRIVGTSIHFKPRVAPRPLYLRRECDGWKFYRTSPKANWILWSHRSISTSTKIEIRPLGFTTRILVTVLIEYLSFHIINFVENNLKLIRIVVYINFD
jgi:hypothetical protein